MHLPDGFLDPRICLATGAVSAAAIGGSLRRLRPEADPAVIPRMGVAAAYIFAAQMVNFPVAAGTSGHLQGALLAAVLLGPRAATLVMTTVLLIQAFFFLDGGYTALGANILNMGLAATWGGFALYRALAGSTPSRGRLLVSASLAAWISVMLGAALAAVQLALSGTAPVRLVLPAMLGTHALIGLGEAAITAGALAVLWRARPELIAGAPAGTARWGWTAAGGLAALAALAPLASSFPDGLEHAAEKLGFAVMAASPSIPSLAPDYAPPGLPQPWAPAVVSLLGALLVLGALLAAGALTSGAADRLRGSPLGGLDARVKLGALLALVLCAVTLPSGDPARLAVPAAIAALWACLARVSALWLLRRALVLLPFLVLLALSWKQSAPQGDQGGALPLLRAAISLLATAAFVVSTPEPEALAAMTAFRLPRPIAETTAFALRYLRVLGEESARMLQARAARSAGSGTLALRAGAAGGIAGSLFVRGYERAERVSLAMAARGPAGIGSTCSLAPPARRDWIAAAGVGLLLAGVMLWP